MRHWINETLNTLSVTTVNPVGWGIRKVHSHWMHSLVQAESEFKEQNHIHHLPVVFVHGIFHNATAFYQLERMLEKAGFRNLSGFELWTSILTVEDLIDRLKNEVLTRATHGKVRLVAHSLGGMITRAALLDPEFSQHIDKVIFLGTPHQSSGWYRLPFPRCIQAFASNSALMQRFRQEPLPGPIDYWNLRGELDLVTPAKNTYLAGAKNIFLPGVGHAGLLSDKTSLKTILAILEAPKNATD